MILMFENKIINNICELYKIAFKNKFSYKL